MRCSPTVGSAGGDASGCSDVVLDSGGRRPPPRSCWKAGSGLRSERIPLARPLLPTPHPFLYVILLAGARCPVFLALGWFLAERTMGSRGRGLTSGR